MSVLVHFVFLAAWAGSSAFLPPLYSSSIIVIWLSVFSFTTLRFARFSWQRKAPFLRGLGYGFAAAFHFPLFFWKFQLRLELTPEEKIQLLLHFQRVTGVSRPSSLLCPFCRIEIPETLAILPNGALGVRKRPILCPRCETRLDCCRFCAFFESRRSSFWEEGISGRCNLLKKQQNVEEICAPPLARKLKEMGWHTLYAGIAIPDAFSPPEECRTFQFDERKSLSEGLSWMGKERVLLLRFEEEVYSHPSSSSRSG